MKSVCRAERMVGGTEQNAAGAEQAAGGAEQVAGGIGQAAGGAEQAAGRAEQTTGRVEQTAGRVEQTAGRVEQTAGGVEQTAGGAERTAGSGREEQGATEWRRQRTGRTRESAALRTWGALACGLQRERERWKGWERFETTCAAGDSPRWRQWRLPGGAARREGQPEREEASGRQGGLGGEEGLGRAHPAGARSGDTTSEVRQRSQSARISLWSKASTAAIKI